MPTPMPCQGAHGTVGLLSVSWTSLLEGPPPTPRTCIAHVMPLTLAHVSSHEPGLSRFSCCNGSMLCLSPSWLQQWLKALRSWLVIITCVKQRPHVWVKFVVAATPCCIQAPLGAVTNHCIAPMKSPQCTSYCTLVPVLMKGEAGLRPLCWE